MHVHGHKKELRIGKDFVASATVLLCKLKLFQGRSLDNRLDAAFRNYMEFCHLKKKNTNIRSFSKREFKMASSLGTKKLTVCVCACVQLISRIHACW